MGVIFIIVFVGVISIVIYKELNKDERDYKASKDVILAKKKMMQYNYDNSTKVADIIYVIIMIFVGLVVNNSCLI